jgi:hypothetical protein
MEPLVYSSNLHSKLNNARRAYWVARHMLSEANKNPGKYDMGLRFWSINRSRNELRKVAHELRAKLPARKVYRITMRGEALDFVCWERAHNRGQAMEQAAKRYPDFNFDSVEALE